MAAHCGRQVSVGHCGAVAEDPAHRLIAVAARSTGDPNRGTAWRQVAFLADAARGWGRTGAGAGVPGPTAEPGDALVLDLTVVPVRSLAD
jgi:hypothetical protein